MSDEDLMVIAKRRVGRGGWRWGGTGAGAPDGPGPWLDQGVETDRQGYTVRTRRGPAVPHARGLGERQLAPAPPAPPARPKGGIMKPLKT